MLRNLADHERVTYRNCRRVIADQNRIGCGGRMFWSPAEPQYEKALGLVGVCCLCAHQVFTGDLLHADQDRGGRVVGSRKKWLLTA